MHQFPTANPLRSPLVISSLRLLETSTIVTVLAFLGTLEAALATPAGIASYNWHTALAALLLGIASGFVNAVIAFLTALTKQSKGTP